MKNLFLSLAVVLFCGTANAQQKFSELVGPFGVQNVKEQSQVEMRYITWGGDVATFYANGGMQTKPNSIYNKLGLNIKLTAGDDFIQQVRDYMSGNTPFLRCTFSMLGQASEVIGSDPRTKPVVLLQISWSAGDHIVCRDSIKTLNDFKKSTGKKVKIAVQQGGPHVGLIYDALLAAQLKKEDVEIVWVTDLTGPKGPAELFKKNKEIDACCVITPDMIGLTGGVDKKGTGAEGTIEGAHVVVSTQQMSRSVCDVIAVRSDYYKSHKDLCEKVVAGYLKGAEEVVRMRKEFNDNPNKMSDSYKQLLTLTQNTFGTEVIPTLEVDAHGLLLDCTFVGLTGQISFFKDKKNLNGFDSKLKNSLDLAVGWGYAANRTGFDPPAFDYKKISEIAGIKYAEPEGTRERISAESVELFPDSNLDDRTIVSFTVSFEPNDEDFSEDRYASEFQRAIQSASTFGNAVVVIRGHSDPTRTLVDLIKAGISKGIIKKTGSDGKFNYYVDGKAIDFNKPTVIADLIRSGAFDGVSPNPRETLAAAQNLSQRRAETVKKSIAKYSKDHEVNLDLTQIQPQGVGIAEPVIPKPKNIEEAKQNMRVEFRVVKIPAEALKSEDFDY